jgi:hypothetical protein
LPLKIHQSSKTNPDLGSTAATSNRQSYAKPVFDKLPQPFLSSTMIIKDIHLTSEFHNYIPSLLPTHLAMTFLRFYTKMHCSFLEKFPVKVK